MRAGTREPSCTIAEGSAHLYSDWEWASDGSLLLSAMSRLLIPAESSRPRTYACMRPRAADAPRNEGHLRSVSSLSLRREPQRGLDECAVWAKERSALPGPTSGYKLVVNSVEKKFPRMQGFEREENSVLAHREPLEVFTA
jgi:hypothetical protein